MLMTFVYSSAVPGSCLLLYRLQVLLRPRHGHAAPYPYAAVIVPRGVPRLQEYTYRLWVSFSWCKSHGAQAR